MTAQHKPPYLRRLRFAADPFWFRPEPLLDPFLGEFNALDVDQKEEASPWKPKLSPLLNSGWQVLVHTIVFKSLIRVLGRRGYSFKPIHSLVNSWCNTHL
jgi:hypothetical protein